ncbi:MAG: hypothetical protein HON60_00025 [Gammaproteobacteria bacterium]|nr:hypothetical protein [Gammaproteobacteria bacterium]
MSPEIIQYAAYPPSIQSLSHEIEGMVAAQDISVTPRVAFNSKVLLHLVAELKMT